MATIQRQQTTSGGSVTGLSSAPLPGWLVSAAWLVSMSGFQLLLLDCILWLLLV